MRLKNRVAELELLSKEAGLLPPAKFSSVGLMPQRTTPTPMDSDASSTQSGSVSYLIGQKVVQHTLNPVQEAKARAEASAAADRFNRERELARQRREADVKAKRAAEKEAMRELDEKKRKSAEVLRAKKEAEARLLKEAEARQKEAELQASRARVELTKKARKEAQLQQQKEVTVQRKRAQSDHTIKRRSANSSATRDKTDEPSNRERTERAAASHRRRQENVARLEESIAALEKRRAEAAAEAAARNSERQLEQKQWATTVEQRVDDNIEDEPAGEYRKELAAETKRLRAESARLLSQRNKELKARLGKVSARVHDQTPQPSRRDTERSKPQGRSDAAESDWLRRLFGGFSSGESSPVRARMGVATTSLVRLDDGVNEDLATFRNRRELERTEAARLTNREPWNASARHYTPSALKGLRLSTKEPWLEDLSVYDAYVSAWDAEGELRPSTAQPMPRTPYDEEAPRKSWDELAAPTATSRSKRKAPVSPKAKARYALRLQQEEERERLEEERIAREAAELAEEQAARERERELRQQKAAEVARIRVKLADGLELTASEQALLREAEAEQDMALLKLLLKKLHGAAAIAPDGRHGTGGKKLLSDADVADLRRLIAPQIERLRLKEPLLDPQERSFLDELEAAMELLQGSADLARGTLVTLSHTLPQLLMQLFAAKCVPLW